MFTENGVPSAGRCCHVLVHPLGQASTTHMTEIAFFTSFHFCGVFFTMQQILLCSTRCPRLYMGCVPISRFDTGRVPYLDRCSNFQIQRFQVLDFNMFHFSRVDMLICQFCSKNVQYVDSDLGMLFSDRALRLWNIGYYMFITCFQDGAIYVGPSSIEQCFVIMTVVMFVVQFPYWMLTVVGVLTACIGCISCTCYSFMSSL